MICLFFSKTKHLRSLLVGILYNIGQTIPSFVGGIKQITAQYHRSFRQTIPSFVRGIKR